MNKYEVIKKDGSKHYVTCDTMGIQDYMVLFFDRSEDGAPDTIHYAIMGEQLSEIVLLNEEQKGEVN